MEVSRWRAGPVLDLTRSCTKWAEDDEVLMTSWETINDETGNLGTASSSLRVPVFIGS